QPGSRASTSACPSRAWARGLGHEETNMRLRNRELPLGPRCLVMGIVNVTPDSFSDGGQFLQADAAITHALELVRQGADLLDVGGGVIVMHMQGTPATMQIAPQYDDVVADIFRFFSERLQTLTALGVPREAIAFDPGIGFGKTRQHNIALLARLAKFSELGRPICLGVSRKGFLGKLLDRPVEERLAGSLAAAAYALAQNAVQIL